MGECLPVFSLPVSVRTRRQLLSNCCCYNYCGTLYSVLSALSSLTERGKSLHYSINQSPWQQQQHTTFPVTLVIWTIWFSSILTLYSIQSHFLLPSFRFLLLSYFLPSFFSLFALSLTCTRSLFHSFPCANVKCARLGNFVSLTVDKLALQSNTTTSEERTRRKREHRSTVLLTMAVALALALSV